MLSEKICKKCRSERGRPFTYMDIDKWTQAGMIDCQFGFQDKHVTDHLENLNPASLLSLMLNHTDDDPPVYCPYVLEHTMEDQNEEEAIHKQL